MPGPNLRTDIVEVYVFRRDASQRGALGVEFLQLHRCRGAVAQTWQPVMGHVEAGETAAQAAQRELAEETGFAPGHGLLALWQLESVNAYFLASHDAVMLSPGFAAEVRAQQEPRLDEAHDDFRWVARDQADCRFLWPGQRQAISQIIRDILPADSPVAPLLRLPL